MLPALAIAAALAAPAAAAAQARDPLEILADPATGDALMWRAARLRLEAWRSGAAGLDQAALNQIAVQWSNAGGPPDRAAEIAALLARADAIAADLGQRMPGARWPADRPAAVWQRIAQARLAMVRTDLEAAARAGHSPEFALEGFAQVARWMQGSTVPTSQFATVFDDVDKAVQAALASVPVPGAGITDGELAAAPGDRTGSVERSAPPAGPIVLPANGPTQVGWLGSGPDVVSPTSAYTDGRADAFLWLRVAARGRAVRMINLSFRDPATGVLCCGAWSTGDQRFPFLGIGTAGGGVVNAPAWRPDGITLPGEIIILAAPGAEQFRAGMTAVATVVYGDGSYESADARVGQPSIGGAMVQPVIGDGPSPRTPPSPSAPAYQPPQRVPGYPPPPPSPGGPEIVRIAPPAPGPAFGANDTLMLSWIGMGGDLAASSGHPGPDNTRDGVFELALPTTGRGVRAITLREVDATGAPRESMWSTTEGGWLSVVTWRGQPITGTAHAPLPGLVLDRVRLHIADPGVLRSGRRFRVTVTYSDGSGATGHTIIP